MSDENIKVLVYIAPPLVIETVTTKENGKKEKAYSGVLYDTWKKIRDRLVRKKYIKGYNETFVGPSTGTTMRDAYNLIVKGDYDIGIGYFSVVSSRDKTHFARPLYLNKFCLAYIPDKSGFRIFIEILFKKFLPPILIGIAISAVLAFLLYFSPFELELNKMWSIMTAVLFMNGGEFLKLENTVFNNFVHFTILMISLFVGVWLQANITVSMSSMKKDIYSNKITKDSIIGKKILAPEGYSTNINWERYGAEIIINKKGQNMLDNYKKNMDKYYGFFDDLEILKRMQRDNKDIIISTENFGYDEITWPINKNKKMYEIMFHINNQIVYLQDNDTIPQLCKKYFMDDFYLCQL